MANIKAIIVDEERLSRVNLRRLLEPFPEIEIAGEASSCTGALELISLQNPQLIFLDIQLHGETGFDLLELIDNSIKIIFVTAYDEYAIQAFDVNAVDYLSKPVNPQRLGEAIERVKNRENNPKRVTKGYEYSDSIFVQLNNHSSRFMKISSISSIEPVGNYSRIVTIEGKHCLVLKTLKQWQEELPENKFVRIHRSNIVNKEYIDHIEKDFKTHQKAYIRNISEPIEVSRRYARKLKAWN
jgi:two-component system LytT family response regulator